MSSTPEHARCYRWGNLLLVAAFLLCFPLGYVLPQWVSWENHLLEMAQNLVLFAGLVVAVRYARRFAGHPVAFLFWIAAIFWLGFLGRELSWGAVLMPSNGMTPWGPSYTSSGLWWKPYVRAALLAMAAVGVYWFLAHKMWRTVALPMLQARALPLVALALYVCTMLITINAEGHGFMDLHVWYGMQSMVLEELVESVGYMALLWMQYCVAQHWQHQIARR